jgi:hypothetical protein
MKCILKYYLDELQLQRVKAKCIIMDLFQKWGGGCIHFFMELYKLICTGMVMVNCKRQNLSTVNNKTYFVRFQVLMAASMKFRIDFWDVLLCKIMVDRRLRDVGCITYL